MDIKEELEKGKEIFPLTGLVDENYMLPYDKVIEAYTTGGWAVWKTLSDIYFL